MKTRKPWPVRALWWAGDHPSIASLLLYVAAVLVFVIALSAAIRLKDTDSSDFGPWDRSGLRLHIDAATGCHSTIFGGPTPRLGEDE